MAPASRVFQRKLSVAEVKQPWLSVAGKLMTQTLFMLLKDCFMRPTAAVGGPGEEFEGRIHRP